MPQWCVKTIVHGGKSNRTTVGGDVRYCPLDPRLKTRVCARTMYQHPVRNTGEAGNDTATNPSGSCQGKAAESILYMYENRMRDD